MKKGYKGEEYEIPDAHPAANCLPWNLEGPDFAALIESVKTDFDRLKPVMIQDKTGLVIDGRRRLLACAIAGVDPVLKDYDMTDAEVIEYVGSHELSGRNLTPEQYAATEVDLAELKGRGEHLHENKEPPKGTAVPLGKTHQQIADASGASKKTVDRLAKLKRSAPELLDTVKEKKLPVNTAVRAAEELTPKQIKKIANSDDPKAEAKKLLGPEKKPAKPAEKPNPFPFGANAPDAEPEVVEPKPQILSTPKGEIAFDAYGRAMPNGIGDYFGDETWKGVLEDGEIAVAALETFRQGVQKAQSTPWLYIDSLKIINKSTDIRNDLIKLMDLIRVGQPYALCGHCDGKKCDQCRNTGYVTKEMTSAFPDLYAAHARKAS